MKGDGGGFNQYLCSISQHEFGAVVKQLNNTVYCPVAVTGHCPILEDRINPKVGRPAAMDIMGVVRVFVSVWEVVKDWGSGGVNVWRGTTIVRREGGGDSFCKFLEELFLHGWDLG